ncbi:MAG: hypothetical protein U0350_01300 [Caldilineaceae bacterium]
MQSTLRIELELPGSLSSKEPKQLQRTMIRHLLLTNEITMVDALALLTSADQNWLVEALLQDAQEALFLADAVNDLTHRTRFWTQYNELLGYLFSWHEYWSEFHNELLALLQTVARRYTPQDLTPERTKFLLQLMQRLQETYLYREDIFAAKRALRELGLQTTLELSSVANQLFPSYLAELNRA